MKISQAELNRYRAQIQERQKESSAYIFARLKQEGVKGMSVTDAREKTIEIMRDNIGVFGDQAQALSASFFDEICDAEDMDADPGIMFDDLIDDSMLEDKVHYYAGKLVDGDWDGYVGSNADLAAFYVHKSALDNMVKNCGLNHVRYARVGTGRETCGFCFMLASRGFVYASEKTAEAGSHHHCDCIIVPGKKGETKIQGYDPDGMRKRFREVYESAGGADSAADAFYEATIKDLDKFTDKDQAKKRARFKTKWISHELEQYDSTWLYRGVKPKGGAKITDRMTDG